MIHTVGFKVTGYPERSLDDVVEYFKTDYSIQVDTETTGQFDFKSKLLCIQLGNRADQFVIAVTDSTKDEISKNLVLLLSDKKYLKILHNAKFDYKVIKHGLGIELENVYDTMLVEVVMNCGKSGVGYSLKDLAKRYLNKVLDKEIRTNIASIGLTNEVVKYAANDVTHLQDIKLGQENHVITYVPKLWATIALENEAVLALADIEYNGMSLNTDKWLVIADEVNYNRDKTKRELDRLVLSNKKTRAITTQQTALFTDTVETGINWSSPVQVLNILTLSGINVKSTEERYLLKHKNSSKLVETLLSYKKYSKLSTSFGKNVLKFINSVTGRIHPDFWQIVSTGRVSCKEPNLLQIPKKGDIGKAMRSCFEAPQGYKIVGGDFEGMELRIIADFSRDKVWCDAFKQGKDLHGELASLVFNIPLEKVRTPFPLKPDVTYRDVQKTIDFGLAYGMSYYKLSDTLAISEDEAINIIDKFFAICPDVKLMLDHLGEIAKDRGYSITNDIYNRIRYFEGYENKLDETRLNSIEREAKNAPIQGTNADIIKEAWVLIRNEVKQKVYPVKLINSIYDEILTECKEEFANEWQQIMQALMIKAAKTVIKSIPVSVDCKVTDCWQK